MEKYNGGSHAKTVLFYHIILVTKYRKRALLGIESDVVKVVRGIESRSKFKVVEIGVDSGDHLHLLVRANPNVAPGQIVSRLKQLSTKELWNSHSKHLSKFFWGSKKILWSGGYYCATVGANKGIVRKYIKDQAK